MTSGELNRGGILSGTQFQLVTNKELKITNASGLGIRIGPIDLVSMAYADDTDLLATTVRNMQALVEVTEVISGEASLEHVPKKTHVIVNNPPARKDCNNKNYLDPQEEQP